MDNRIPQYQRAVTPTIESNAPSGLIRGKVLSYNNTNNSTSNNLIRGSPYIRNSPITLSPRQPVTGGYIDINVMGRNASSQSKAAVANKANEQPTTTTSGPGNFSKYDLIPIQDEVPLDGIIFSKLRSNHEALVVHRTTEERLRNPERLNLDKRQLEICPILEQEQKLRLLNFQNNYIRVIQNLENLPNLIFLDLYNNKITTLAGSLSMVKGLRVLMTGKNKISAITNLTNLRKLDVLDLHSNDISVVEGLDTLVDLRVLNLAGNKITQIQNGLSALGSLTELNLRRNKLDNVNGLNKLPALQRVFLSHNLISSVEGVQSLFEVPYLIELSLDGNPLSEEDPEAYRKAIIAGISGLRHLDLKRVTDEERHPYQESDLGLSIADAEGSNSLLARSPSEMGGISAASTHNHSAATLPDPDHRPNIADLGNKSPIHSEGNILSRITSRASLQKYIKSSIESMVTDAAHGCRNDIPEKPATSSTDTDKQKEKEKEKEQPTVPETLTSLARSGKITSTSSLFDIEILGPDEKALIAIGNTWEWTPSKRLLASVVEASLCHMKRQTFMHKFNSTHMQMLPALKVMRFLNVDFVTLTQMEVIPPLLKDQIESLSVRGCPISVSMSSQVLRAYFLAAMPKLKVFNDKEITLQDRQECAVMYSSFIRVRLLAEARMSAITPQQRTIHNNGALLRNNRNSALMRDFRNRAFIDRMHYNDGSESEASAANGSAPSLGSSTIEFLNSTKEHPSVVELSASVLRRRILYKHYILNFDKSMEKLFVEALDEVQSNKKILNIFSIFKTASSYIGGGIPSKVYSASVGTNAILKAQSAQRSDVNKPDRFIHPQVLKMFRRAQFLIRNGDNAVAKKLLQRCLELSPFDSHSWLALARLEAKIGNIENARKIFSQSNDKCPRNLHLLHAWGHLEQKHGNIDVARDCWSRALELDPLNAYVCHALSNLEKRLRNFDRAREVLTNVVNRRPTAALCVSLAELERALGRPEEARGVLLSGIENCQTEKSTLLLSLAWLEEDAFDKPDEAAAMIDEALHLDSKNIRVYIAKASILLRQQKVSEARAVLQACAGLKSDDGQHYTMWSTLELEDGNPSEARTILQEGARLYPGDQFLLQRWGTLESRLGNIEKARELFAKSVLIQPHAPTFVAWAILEEGEGIKALNKSSSWSGPNMMKVVPNSDRAVANSIADEISELELQSHEYSSHPDLHSIPTMVYGKEHSNSSQQASVASYAAAKFKEARNLFSIGMEVDPYHGPLYHAFGNSELRKWNISGAREIFQLGIRNNCSDMTALYHALGLLEIKDGHRSLAGDIFRKGIELGLKGNREVDPGVGFLLHSLGMLELDNRNLLEAKTVFATGISLFPNHSQMLLGQALVSMKLGEHQQARLFFRQSVDADAIHLHAWQSWAIAEKQFGNIELARILFRQGLKHGPMHGALWQGYAVMEMQQGNSEIARSLFAQAVRRAPSHAQSYQAWACLEVRLGNLEQAKALAWEGVRRAPSHAALWTVAGLVEERLGNTAKAREVLKMGLDLFPSHGALYKVLGELEMKHGAVTLARELFSRGLDEDPYYAPVYHAAALLEAKTGNLEKLSELHKKAKAYFSSSMKKMLSAKGGKHALNDVDSIPIVDITLDDERNSREKENIDIIKRIQILEQTAQDSLRNGKDYIQDINVEEQQYGIDSESFMINLGHQ